MVDLQLEVEKEESDDADIGDLLILQVVDWESLLKEGGDGTDEKIKSKSSRVTNKSTKAPNIYP